MIATTSAASTTMDSAVTVMARALVANAPRTPRGWRTLL